MPTKPKWCRSTYGIGDDNEYRCQLPFGHEGDHRHESDESDAWCNDVAHIVLTWRPNPKYQPPRSHQPSDFRMTPEKAKRLGLEGATIFS